MSVVGCTARSVFTETLQSTGGRPGKNKETCIGTVNLVSAMKEMKEKDVTKRERAMAL